MAEGVTRLEQTGRLSDYNVGKLSNAKKWWSSSDGVEYAGIKDYLGRAIAIQQGEVRDVSSYRASLESLYGHLSILADLCGAYDMHHIKPRTDAGKKRKAEVASLKEKALSEKDKARHIMVMIDGGREVAMAGTVGESISTQDNDELTSIFLESADFSTGQTGSDEDRKNYVRTLDEKAKIGRGEREKGYGSNTIGVNMGFRGDTTELAQAGKAYKGAGFNDSTEAVASAYRGYYNAQGEDVLREGIGKDKFDRYAGNMVQNTVNFFLEALLVYMANPTRLRYASDLYVTLMDNETFEESSSQPDVVADEVTMTMVMVEMTNRGFFPMAMKDIMDKGQALSGKQARGQEITEADKLTQEEEIRKQVLMQMPSLIANEKIRPDLVSQFPNPDALVNKYKQIKKKVRQMILDYVEMNNVRAEHSAMLSD